MRSLPITGEYPAGWGEIGDRVRAENGHRCIRCGHRYKTGEHGKGEWSPCDDQCRHMGPLHYVSSLPNAAPVCVDGHDVQYIRAMYPDRVVYAQWRILTVHHLDGDKSNCVWWNLLSLCQRCHLTIQSRVNPAIPYFLEHSAWFRLYVAGYYAKRYEGRDITREEASARLDELLAYERIA